MYLVVLLLINACAQNSPQIETDEARKHRLGLQEAMVFLNTNRGDATTIQGLAARSYKQFERENTDLYKVSLSFHDKSNEALLQWYFDDQLRKKYVLVEEQKQGIHIFEYYEEGIISARVHWASEIAERYYLHFDKTSSKGVTELESHLKSMEISDVTKRGLGPSKSMQTKAYHDNLKSLLKANTHQFRLHKGLYQYKSDRETSIKNDNIFGNYEVKVDSVLFSKLVLE